MYVKIIVSTIVALYLTRVVLNVLGVSDFGIYNVIAGVIAVLAFLESSLLASTQRYLAVAIGEKNEDKYKRYFSSSIIIHFVFAFIIILLLELCGVFLFDGFLTIPIERIPTAKIVYQLMIFSTCITVLCIPYNAMINAEEDIWFYGLWHIICSLLRLLVIFGFAVFDTDSLLLYSLWIAIITIVKGLGSLVWCQIKYSHCRNCHYSYSYNKSYIHDLLGFTGWNTFGSFAIVSRNQGVAIILNHFFNPAINAVYGIANQVNGQLAAFANTLTASLTPQIAKSYGEGNQSKLIFLTVLTSKMAFMLSAIFALPFIIEMPIVLKIWLKEVPEFTEFYCGTIVYMFLLNEMYPGLSRGIQAVGVIRNRELVCSIVIILPIFLGAVLFSYGLSHQYIVYLILFSQFIIVFVNIYFAHKLYGLNYKSYLIECLKFSIVYFVAYISSYFLDYFLILRVSDFFRFMIVCLFVEIVFTTLFYNIVYNNVEKEAFVRIVSRFPIFNKIIKILKK